MKNKLPLLGKMMGAGIFLALFLSGCWNDLTDLGGANSDAQRSGNVTITIAAGNSARTLLPDPNVISDATVFERVELEFLREEDRALKTLTIFPQTDLSGSIDLDDGDWTISAFGFVLINGIEYEAAQGSASISVPDEDEVSIALQTGIFEGKPGVLNYNITYPNVLLTGGLIEVVPFTSGTGSHYEAVDLGEASSGSLELAPGYYLLNVSIFGNELDTQTDDGSTVGEELALYWTELVHIYSGQETNAETSFSPEDFFVNPGDRGTPISTWHGLTVPSGTTALFYETKNNGSDVLRVIPGGGANYYNVLEYDLNAYAGQQVTIDVSMRVWLDTATKVVWQIAVDGADGASDYPLIAGSWNDLTTGEWHYIESVAANTVTVRKDSPLYLSADQLGDAELYINSFVITVTPVQTGGPWQVNDWNGLTVPQGTTAYLYEQLHNTPNVLYVAPSSTGYGWSVLEYDLKEYVGKEVTISISVDVWMEGAGAIYWQVNQDTYPIIAQSGTLYSSQWQTISGSNTLTVNSNNVIYLSGGTDQINGAAAYLANLTIRIVEVTGSGANPGDNGGGSSGNGSGTTNPGDDDDKGDNGGNGSGDDRSSTGSGN